MSYNIKDFYFDTPMHPRFEYMRIPAKDIPTSTIDQCALTPLIHQGHVLVESRKGMYGLPQAGILANTRLKKHLEKYGYTPAARTPGLFTHASRPITFALIVDDFGVKYVGKENAEHLGNVIRDLYTITEDWKGNIYLGITLDWNYAAKTVDLSMLGYIEKGLTK
jgi:hypothetical protein